VSRLFDEALAPTGLKSGQFNILCAVAAGDVTTAGQVAALLAMDRTTLSRNLKPLRAAGYVTSEGGAGRRPDTLTLTHAGRVVLDEGVSLWRTVQSSLAVRLGAGQSSLLLHSLETATKAAAV
jgi:DNA-binding MarR family transcriptional regulator